MAAKKQRKKTVEKTRTFYRGPMAKPEVRSEEERTVEVAFSSEFPVERYYGWEVLGHEPGEVDLSRMPEGFAPVLVQHDARDHVGVVESVSLGRDKVLRATLRYGSSARAEEIFADVREGIRTQISVGYRVKELVLEKSNEEGDFYRATDWGPVEISHVAVAADPTVGVGRSDGDEFETVFLREEEEASMIEVIRLADGVRMQIREEDYDPETYAKAEKVRGWIDENEPAPSRAKVKDTGPSPDQVRTEAREAETKRVRELETIGAKWNASDEAQKFVADGRSVADFRAWLIDERLEPDKPFDTPETDIGLSEKELRKFSLLNLIRSQVDPAYRGADFEKECSRTIEEKLGDSPRGMFVPYDVLRDPQGWTGRAAVAKGGTGDNIIATDLLTGSFIDILRKKAVVMSMGARALDGLVGDVDISRQSGSATAAWVAEGGGAGDTPIALDKISLVPQTLRARSDMTRKMILQSTPAIEGLVRADLVAVMGLALDDAALQGSGVAPIPRGVINQAGVGVTNFSALATLFLDLVKMETGVATLDADIGSLGYVSTAKFRGSCKSIEKFATTGMTIWEQGNTVNGYPVGLTNLLPDDGGVGNDETTTVFGNWADLLLGFWGVLDVTAEGITLADSGGIAVRAFQDADANIRHPESFNIMEDAIL